MNRNLNILKIKTDDDIKSIFEYVVDICNEALKIRNNDNTDFYDAQFANLVCCSVLGQLGIKCDIMQIEKGELNHCFTFVLMKVNDNNKYFILDPVFEKFLIIKHPQYKTLRLNLEKTARGKELISQIIEYGYFECNDIDLKLYFDAIILSASKDFKKVKSKKTGADYLKNMEHLCFGKQINKKR